MKTYTAPPVEVHPPPHDGGTHYQRVPAGCDRKPKTLISRAIRSPQSKTLRHIVPSRRRLDVDTHNSLFNVASDGATRNADEYEASLDCDRLAHFVPRHSLLRRELS